MTQEQYKREARRLRPELLSTARRYLDGDEAEDAVQDTLLRLWQMVDDLRCPVDAFAAVLTRNICIDRLRRRHVTVPLTDAGPEEAPDDARIERMMAVVDTLPPLQQTILRLRHMEGMEMSDIADLIGTNEVALRKALSRARQTVREKYLKRYE